MASSINASTSGAGGLITTADNTGNINIQSGGSTVLALTSSGITVTGTIASSTGTTYPIVSGTSVASTSGTSIDFTGIPSWAKRITVMFNGVSTNGTSNLLIQLGDSGGIETTGYVSAANYSTNTNASGTAGFFILYGVPAAANTFHGCVIFCNLSGNTWVMNGNIADDGQRNSSSAGSKTLSDILDRVRLTTVNGTDTFDAGSVNIIYE